MLKLVDIFELDLLVPCQFLQVFIFLDHIFCDLSCQMLFHMFVIYFDLIFADQKMIVIHTFDPLILFSFFPNIHLIFEIIRPILLLILFHFLFISCLIFELVHIILHNSFPHIQVFTLRMLEAWIETSTKLSVQLIERISQGLFLNTIWQLICHR